MLLLSQLTAGGTRLPTLLQLSLPPVLLLSLLLPLLLLPPPLPPLLLLLLLLLLDTLSHKWRATRHQWAAGRV